MDLRDPALVAIEMTAIKGEFALLSSQVSQGIGNLTSQVSAIQGEFREHGRVLRSVESAQLEMQAHSNAVDRLARAIEAGTAENMRWRKDHEGENRVVADRVTTFRGIMLGVTILAGAAFTIAMNWITAEFSNVRGEATREAVVLAEKRSAIEATHKADIAQIHRELDEIKPKRQ